MALTIVITGNSPMIQAQEGEETSDFGKGITSATIQVKENNVWNTVEKEITDGDELKVTLQFTIPDDMVTQESKSIYYQLPKEIVPNEEQKGKVYNGNTAVGTYSITPQGLLTIEFYSDFIDDGKGFSGSIMFQGKATLDNNETSATITFGGSGESITILNPQVIA